MRQASQSALEFPEPTGRSIHAEADTFARRNYGGDYARGRNPVRYMCLVVNFVLTVTLVKHELVNHADCC